MHAIDYFATTLPARPHCANDPQADNRIRPRAKALGYRLIEPNSTGSLRWLAFDVDRPGAAIDWEDRHVPAPTITCQNPDNGHAHLLYALSAPVARTSAARLKPLHYAEMIEHSLRTALGADKGYSGNLVKNPAHPHWRVTAWADAYSLDDLADNLTMVPRSRRSANDDEIAGLGRNCETFERLRLHAYKAVRDYWGPNGEERFHAHLLAVATDMQTAYVESLPYSEVKGIAKSVGRWVWRRFDREKFRRIQAHRGSKKGKARRDLLLPQVIEMHAQGHSNRVIASTLGVDDKTVGNWLRSIRA
ncbi:replication initiation protein [Modicisalibacter sp. 'Wilcox']|uniref:replication initiation protein n=1 Tax=Modicisalibacter sp. 'Wilcox' TaxID=2679914 RepID=UPI0013D3A994|nr:replication initiation protein [Modicisalibacter sp. 'Wilcox']